jgi:tetratricopeptide (TPR) repeat protein
VVVESLKRALRFPVGKVLSVLFALRRKATVVTLSTEPSATGIRAGSAQSSNTQEIRQALVVWLRRKLRRFPYWLEGQLAFTRLTIEMKDLAAAYASLQAAFQLAPHVQNSLEGQLLLGKIYLRSGRVGTAKEIFEDLFGEHPESAEIAEEYAACLLTEKNLPRVKEILSKFSASALSPEGQAVLQMVSR